MLGGVIKYQELFIVYARIVKHLHKSGVARVIRSSWPEERCKNQKENSIAAFWAWKAQSSQRMEGLVITKISFENKIYSSNRVALINK